MSPKPPKQPKVPKDDTDRIAKRSPTADSGSDKKDFDVSTYTSARKVDEAAIKQLADMILKDHVDVMTACDFLLLDPASVMWHYRKGSYPDAVGLSRFTYDMIRAAQARSEVALVRRWLGNNTLHSSSSQQFLERTKERYRQKHALQVAYEVTAILEVVQSLVTPEQFADIVAQVQRLNGAEVLSLLDTRAGITDA